MAKLDKGWATICYNGVWMTLEQVSFNQYKLDGKRVQGGSLLSEIRKRSEELIQEQMDEAKDYFTGEDIKDGN